MEQHVQIARAYAINPSEFSRGLTIQTAVQKARTMTIPIPDDLPPILSDYSVPGSGRLVGVVLGAGDWGAASGSRIVSAGS